ncbi:cell surface glycoprotein MUC18-like isoform X1 [Sinocyclocheilus grahami]|uniref:cell surface glycoprotein MUC18-like isoform X1 n=1 Tax=Sinocyclocheilus grahami TaxID=75366 RepID=UPI0007AC7F57|nr:PREDICTED: cell surface glycoprotein MUC18-like isoform X1 [Sinocyclocheilus grahami]XP_016149481.1 PREDICTED: cell surface glycoprotein MUC18-like isoform X1 [Sinocyclocheilus grahami]
MALRYIALLIAGLSVLTCKTWAIVDVSMEDRVDVFLKGQAEIPCIYTLKEPAKMIVWFTKWPGRDQSRRRIYYYDDQNEIIEEGSEYAGRIKVTHSHEPQNARGSAILIIDNVQLSDQREFICTVLNVSTDSAEGHTRLQIFNSPSLPVIEGMHTGISVTVEEPSKVAHCKVDDGYPRPNITWYKDRFPLQQSDGEVKTMESVTTKPNSLLTVDSELYIKVKRTDEDALFYCEVKYFVPGGVRMTESKKINITVYYPTTEVTMSVNPPDRLIKEGDTVEIRCEGNGKPQPFFDFTHNGNELSSNEEMLLLENVKRSSSGTYVCQSIDFDTNTVAEDSINMTVHYLDHIVVTPEETVLDQGEDLTLTCNALSSLPTQTAWYKDGMRLVERHVLELNNASYDTAGMYMCEVTVPSLPELREQKSVQISVRGKPKITEEIAVGPVNMADRSVNLTCYAEGYPFPTITWTLSDQWTGQPVPVPEVENQKTDTGVLSMISVRAVSKLTANCSAANEFGTVNVSRKIEAFARVTTTTTQATSTKGTGLTIPPKQPRTGGGSGVIIAVIIICLLLIAILGSVLYFLYKKGKLPCGRSGKQDFTKEKASKDDIVMEMKSGKSEEAVLLQVNGDKTSPTE